MRIAMIADAYLLDETTGINGTQVQMYNLANAFARRGVDVHYVSITRDVGMPTCDTHGLTMHWIHQRGKGGPGFDWFCHMQTYRKELDQINPDVVYQRGRSFLTYVAAKWAQQTGRKFVWGSNGEDSAEFWKMSGKLCRSKRSFWKKSLLGPTMFAHDLLIHRGTRGAKVIVNQTEFQQRRLKENFGKTGVMLPSYTLPPIQDGANVKQQCVLWLANLSRDKQPELFLDLAEHCRGIAGWTFVLGGGTSDQSYARQIAVRAAGISNVRITGLIPYLESNNYYARAALYAHTSRSDGIPNAFIQSWLNRTPVLSLNFNPNNWIDRYRIGFFADGDMKRFLEQGREYLINYQPGNTMEQASEDFARSKFASDSIIDTYLEIFTHCCPK